jgi:hypothetical protein
MISFDSNGSRTLHHMGDDDAFLTIELSTNVKRMRACARTYARPVNTRSRFFFLIILFNMGEGQGNGELLGQKFPLLGKKFNY